MASEELDQVRADHFALLTCLEKSFATLICSITCSMT